MAETTAISWADKTFNPWVGCTKVSPGCDNCYAEGCTKAKRLHPDAGGTVEAFRELQEAYEAVKAG